jgi:hypothetical protein
LVELRDYKPDRFFTIQREFNDDQVVALREFFGVVDVDYKKIAEVDVD